MRIVHITPDYHPVRGGGELYVKEASERLAARGHDVTVLAMNSRGTSDADGRSLPREQVIGGVRVRRLNNWYTVHQRILAIRGSQRALCLVLGDDRFRMLSVSPWSPLAFFLTLRARADVVAVFNWYHGSLAYQTAAARDLGRFAFVGVPLLHTERPWAHSALLGQVLSRCDAVATMTGHERTFVEHRSAQPLVRVVGAGVDPESFARVDGAGLRRELGLGDEPIVGYVGRMSATKGVITLVAAMKQLWQQRPSVRLLLAGSGLPPGPGGDADVRGALDSLTAAERSRVVTIASLTDEMKPSVFDALDVFAMPSVAESFGIAYLEAWMCRKPVVGARIPATECVIQDGIDGRLVTPGSPGELAEVLGMLVGDADLRERFGRAGYDKTMRSFTWDQVVDRLEAAYVEARTAGARQQAP